MGTFLVDILFIKKQHQPRHPSNMVGQIQFHRRRYIHDFALVVLLPN